MECCSQCGSYRGLRSWGLGSWGGRPWLVVLPDETLSPTLALDDLFPTGHQHEWRLTRHRLNGIPGALGTLLCNGLRRNAFANAYEEYPPLREFVLGEVRAGRVTRQEILGMLHLSRSNPWEDSGAEKALRARALGWMREYAPEAPTYFMDGAGSLLDAAADYRQRASDAQPR